MKTEDIKKMAQAWKQVQEASYGKPKKEASDTQMGTITVKTDAERKARAQAYRDKKAATNEAMDPVDHKELKGKHKDRKDKDINNDGKVDSTDKYLHNRRKTVSAAIKGKKNGQEVEVQTNEGSIKGSGTDRKAVLKKAYRDGEQKTRNFYKGTITPDPKTKDQGVKKAFAKGKGAGHGSSTRQGATRSSSWDRLRNTEHGRSEPEKSAFGTGTTGKTHYKTQTHAAKMSAIKHFSKKGKLPESLELDEGIFGKKSKINIGKLHDLHAYHERKAEAHVDAQQKHDSNSKMADHHSHQAVEHDTAAEHLHNASKAYDKGDHKAVAKHVDLYHKTSVALGGIKEAAKELDEISKKTLGSYIKKASSDQANQAYNLGSGKEKDFTRAFKRKAGIAKATDKLTKEAKDHGNMNNGSPEGEGLSPSAKDQLAKKTPAPAAFDADLVNKKTFDAMRASAKKAKMRTNDNPQGDKTPPKSK